MSTDTFTLSPRVCQGALLAQAGYTAEEAPDWDAEIEATDAAGTAPSFELVEGAERTFRADPYCWGCEQVHLGQDMYPVSVMEVAE